MSFPVINEQLLDNLPAEHVSKFGTHDAGGVLFKSDLASNPLDIPMQEIKKVAPMVYDVIKDLWGTETLDKALTTWLLPVHESVFATPSLQESLLAVCFHHSRQFNFGI